MVHRRNFEILGLWGRRTKHLGIGCSDLQIGPAMDDQHGQVGLLCQRCGILRHQIDEKALHCGRKEALKCRMQRRDIDAFAGFQSRDGRLGFVQQGRIGGIGAQLLA